MDEKKGAGHNRDADLYDDSVPAEPQKFLPEPEMEARLARILRRC